MKHQDFFGTWLGEYDGRKAKLVISDTKGDSPHPMLHLRFTELERDETYVGTVTQDHDSHVLTHMTLKRVGGSGYVTWKRLKLEDRNSLSGISTWNGNEYGMSFTRSHS